MTDLYLASVVLAVDARIEELGQLDAADLAAEVGLASDRADRDANQRAKALVEAVQHLIDCHHWTLSWDPRGIRLAHADHHLVLGVPETFRDFVHGPLTDEPT
jgi:hypothetical protein